jgi:hypothetical protein
MSIHIITAGVVILFAFLGYKSFMGLIHANGNTASILIHSSILIFFTTTLILSYMFAPKSYSIDKDNFVIHRPISDKIIKLDSVIEIREVNKSELKGMIRTFGVGGLFGNYGKFYTQNLGSITMYGTQNKNFILITAGERKILITPDDLSIIDQIKNRK